MGACDEAFGVSLGETAPSADLGGSSKYSNENVEGRSGEGFHVNSCSWLSTAVGSVGSGPTSFSAQNFLCGAFLPRKQFCIFSVVLRFFVSRPLHDGEAREGEVALSWH